MNADGSRQKLAETRFDGPPATDRRRRRPRRERPAADRAPSATSALRTSAVSDPGPPVCPHIYARCTSSPLGCCWGHQKAGASCPLAVSSNPRGQGDGGDTWVWAEGLGWSPALPVTCCDCAWAAGLRFPPCPDAHHTGLSRGSERVALTRGHPARTYCKLVTCFCFKNKECRGV